MGTMDVSVGIDVSKATLDVAISGQQRILRLANTPTGWVELCGLLATFRQPLVVLEATNRYHEGVTAALQARGTTVAIANPLHTAAYRQALGKLSKSDAIDARVLERFAASLRPAPTPPPDARQREIRELSRARTDLVTARVQLRLQASTTAAVARPHYEATIGTITAQIADLDHTLRTLITATPVLANVDAILQSLPGLGPTSSAALLGDLPELGTLNRRQIASLGGLAPRQQQSGTRTLPATVWGGRREVRRVLYLVTMRAIQQRNSRPCARGAEAIRARYDALIHRGKAPRVALIAVARWLLTILNVMVRDGLRWEETAAFQKEATTA
jgi:transposase